MKEQSKLPQDPLDHILWIIVGLPLLVNTFVGVFGIFKYSADGGDGKIILAGILSLIVTFLGSLFCLYQFRKKLKESRDSSNNSH